MRQDREQDRMRRFEERWKEWSHRPPRQDARQAARRVMAQLDESFPAPSKPVVGPWTWRLATAAVVAVLAAGFWLLLPGLPHPIPGPAPQAPLAETATPVMDDGVVLLWLDAETPLYMTFAPPKTDRGAEKGEGS